MLATLRACSGSGMRVLVRLLEEHAERCIQLAYQCRTKNAERFLRLLAVDLMLAAELRRPRGKAVEDDLEELSRPSEAASSS